MSAAVNFTLQLIARDLKLALRRPGDVLNMLFFFVVVVSLFPLSLGADPALLRQLAPAVVWVSAMLASMLGLQRMFGPDHEDGTLEQMLLSPHSTVLLALAKALSHWLLAGLPLVLLSPLMGLQYDLPADALSVLALSLLIGTPVLSLMGGVGAALTLGARGGGVLLGLLVLPLFIPVLIFGSGASYAHAAGMAVQGHVSILLACLLLTLCFAPWATALALKVAME